MKIDNNLIPDRRIHVSWEIDKDDQPYLTWKKKFFDTSVIASEGPKRFFFPATETGDRTAGSLRSSSFANTDITDFVGILTQAYVLSNMDRRGKSANGELARFIDYRQANDEDKDHIRVFLAPLDAPRWKDYVVRRILLHDPDREHASWLKRLREDRFPLTTDCGPGPVSEHISEAVDMIVNEAETSRKKRGTR